MLSVVMLSVVMLSVVMLSVVMLNVIMLSVVMLSVVRLCAIAPLHDAILPATTSGFCHLWQCVTRNTKCRGRLSIVDLLIKVAHFVTKVQSIFNLKMCRSKLVSTWRSTVLSFPVQ